MVYTDDAFTLQPVAFEICCGSAGLSAALKRSGFQTLAIDHVSNRHSTKVKIFVLDVSNENQLDLLMSMISFIKPCYIHMGLPCGTCSRARERPMPAKLGGHMGPKPLHDGDHLLGLPDLSGANKIKVEGANELYNCAITILLLCSNCSA